MLQPHLSIQNSRIQEIIKDVESKEKDLIAIKNALAQFKLDSDYNKLMCVYNLYRKYKGGVV